MVRRVLLLSTLMLLGASPVTDQKVIAANRMGLIEYCFNMHILDADLDVTTDALKTRRRGAGKAGDKAHDRGAIGEILQGATLMDIAGLAAQINRPTRWLCSEVADQAVAPAPLPAVLP